MIIQPFQAAQILYTQSVANQPDNLVMLCKFKSFSLFISLEIHSLYGQKHRKICVTKYRAGFATVHYLIV